MKMKAYASFDEYLADQSPKNQRIIRALRKFVKRVAPALTESVKWGNGCWLGGKGPVAYVYSDPGFVQFGFFRGATLTDPLGLLEGKGAYWPSSPTEVEMSSACFFRSANSASRSASLN